MLAYWMSVEVGRLLLKAIPDKGPVVFLWLLWAITTTRHIVGSSLVGRMRETRCSCQKKKSVFYNSYPESSRQTVCSVLVPTGSALTRVRQRVGLGEL